MTRDGKSYYYLTDATGNILGAVDHTGTRTYAYTPTGTPRTTPTETVPQPYRYAGAYNDPTGLYKMGARYYDPTLGRFTQPDPSGQETNTYLYAGGDPVNRIDPTGLGFLDGLKRATKTSMEYAIGGAIAGCVTTAVEGCVGGAVVGGFGGALGGLAVGGYKEATG